MLDEMSKKMAVDIAVDTNEFRTKKIGGISSPDFQESLVRD
jgi:hypothetical protein